MDWNLAIEMNREALKRVLATLVAMAGFGGAAAFTSPLWGGRREASGGGEPSEKSSTPTRQPDDCRPPHKGEVDPTCPTLPRHLHRAVLRLLRPAEAAARRLIVVAARGIVIMLPPPRLRKAKAKPSLFVRNGIGTGIVLPLGAGYPGPAGKDRAPRRPSGFAAFDPLRNSLRRRRPKSSGVPRIWALDGPDPIFIPVRKPPLPDDPIDATGLGRRLTALGHVLDDLPKHAKRFAHWRAHNLSERNRERLSSSTGRLRLRRLSPLRPGPPPGSPRRRSRWPAHEIHEILANTHGLAFLVLQHRDTS